MKREKWSLSLMCKLQCHSCAHSPEETSLSPLLQEREGMLSGPQWGFVGRCSQAFGHTPWVHGSEHCSD